MESNDDGTPKTKLLTDQYVQDQLRKQSGYTGESLEVPRLLSLFCSATPMNGRYAWQVREFLPKETLWSESDWGGFTTEYIKERIVEIGFEPTLAEAVAAGAKKLEELTKADHEAFDWSKWDAEAERLAKKSEPKNA